MDSADFSDATLVLIGHGSTLNADSAAPIYQHADALRRRGIFARVLEAFWKQEPSIAGVLRGVFTSRVFAVPLFISEGYFTEEVIPRELGLPRTGPPGGFRSVGQVGDRTVYYCRPIGTHPSMTGVILERAQQVIEQYPFPRPPLPSQTSLFIAGHGTGANENSRQAIESQVRLIRALGRYGEVHPIFMEEEPRISACYALSRLPNIVVVPFFISDGLHSFEDIPVLLGEPAEVVQERLRQGLPTWRNPTEKKGKLVWYSPSVGNEPHIPDVILERVREMANPGNEP